MRSHKLGQDGEVFAQEFLKKQGYCLVTINYRVKLGEIDIIADDHGTLVFIEVKTREQDGWNAFEAVSLAKQRKLTRVATQYLVETFGKVDVSARFDVLAVYAGEDGLFQADLLKNAFGI